MARAHPHKRVARAAAISILTLIATLAATWLAPRASDAVAAWLRTPDVRTQTTALSAPLPVNAPASAGAARHAAAAPDAGTADDAVTIDPGLRFNLVGVICRPPAQSAEVVVQIRTSLDGSSWGEWYSVALEVASEGDGSRPQAFTEPLWTGAARYVQVAARQAAGLQAAPLALRGVKVVALNSTEDADRGATLLGVLRRTAAAVAGLELVPPLGAMTTKPAIVTRAEWGADESYRAGSPSFAPVKMVFVHHTASGNDYTRAEAPAIVRAVYAYHTRSLHWSDVGYNFLIDRYGTLYEGRYGGVTKGAIGAQTLGFNTGSIGVSVIGDFTKATPPGAAVSALEHLLAWKLDVHHVDPQGRATLVCGYGEKYGTGQSVEFPVIAGHRDANYTGCPGDRLYAQLPAIRKAVAAIGQPKIYGFDVAGTYFSPDGDGVRDKAEVAFAVSEVADWSIEIRQPNGDVVRRMSGQGAAAAATWGGKDGDGRDLPDGTYTLIASAKSARGEARTATVDVHIDTTPPRLESAAVAPSAFSPNGDGQADSDQGDLPAGRERDGARLGDRRRRQGPSPAHRLARRRRFDAVRHLGRAHQRRRQARGGAGGTRLPGDRHARSGRQQRHRQALRGGRPHARIPGRQPADLLSERRRHARHGRRVVQAHAPGRGHPGAGPRGGSAAHHQGRRAPCRSAVGHLGRQGDRRGVRGQRHLRPARDGARQHGRDVRLEVGHGRSLRTAAHGARHRVGDLRAHREGRLLGARPVQRDREGDGHGE